MSAEKLKEMFLAQEAWDTQEATKTLSEHFVKLQEAVIHLQQIVAEMQRQRIEDRRLNELLRP